MENRLSLIHILKWRLQRHLYSEFVNNNITIRNYIPRVQQTFLMETLKKKAKGSYTRSHFRLVLEYEKFVKFGNSELVRRCMSWTYSSYLRDQLRDIFKKDKYLMRSQKKPLWTRLGILNSELVKQCREQFHPLKTCPEHQTVHDIISPILNFQNFTNFTIDLFTCGINFTKFLEDVTQYAA